MTPIGTRLDPASWIVVVITLALFVTAVFVKGLGHDLLLEAGVFLVSVKLILMSYKSRVATDELSERLHELRAMLMRVDARLGAHTEHDHAKPPTTPHDLPEPEAFPPEIGTAARR